MSIKDKIKQLINVIEDTDINQIEVSSFWGAQKIKLTKKISTTESYIPTSQNVIHEQTVTEKTNTETPIMSDKKNEVSDTDIESSDSKSQTENEVSHIDEENLSFQKAPLVGTFYLSPKPGDPPFIKIGDKVHKGQIICIIEAMKIFNEIECDFDGTIHEILIDDASPVEFNQSIISIIPE